MHLRKLVVKRGKNEIVNVLLRVVEMMEGEGKANLFLESGGACHLG